MDLDRAHIEESRKQHGIKESKMEPQGSPIRTKEHIVDEKRDNFARYLSPLPSEMAPECRHCDKSCHAAAAAALGWAVLLVGACWAGDNKMSKTIVLFLDFKVDISFMMFS
ncbi:hypothetical protein PoB_004117300 [Plakobranchus ocellatus]|uniref:Uncharacterized protein n=1 Tax=Plakobranchus ocellatus TaxID=259542 RepID=A0AAV4B7A6_9GAST|nr:hypothetical protein PoB_004117300 [Plakobranchus ocellatus]